MATYLVTGGAGFIGSHLGESLMASGNRVICLDSFSDSYDYRIKMRNVQRDSCQESVAAIAGKEEALAELKRSLDNPLYRLETVDIRDASALDFIFQSERIDAVVHLAALPGVRASMEQPLLFDDVNVRGTLLLLEAMKKHGVRKWVCASSSSVYGNNERIPFAESDPVDSPISLYAATKKSCELMGHTYWHLYGIDVVMLRFFTVYGERQRPDLAIHKFAKLIDQGQEIPFYGDGSTKRDYTYIGDIVSGIRGALDYVENNDSVYEIVNLGNSRMVSLSEMVECLENELGRKALLKRLPAQPGDMKTTFADIGKAGRLIGYEPRTRFEDGIRNFARWYGGRTS